MKISLKIALFSSIFLVTMVFSIAYLVIIDLREQGEIERQAFRKATITEVKQNLKDLVDVAYETIDQNYSNLQNKGFLEKYYGYRLRTTIDTVESILKRNYGLAKEGKMSDDQAREQSLATIAQIRYEDVDGNQYRLGVGALDLSFGNELVQWFGATERART